MIIDDEVLDFIVIVINGDLWFVYNFLDLVVMFIFFNEDGSCYISLEIMENSL